MNNRQFNKKILCAIQLASRNLRYAIAIRYLSMTDLINASEEFPTFFLLVSMDFLNLK